MNRSALSLFISLTVFFTCQSIGLSEEFTWTDAGDNDLWTNAQNWSPQMVPGPQGDVKIFGSPPTVNVAAGLFANSLEIGPDGRLEMHGGGLAIQSGMVTNNGRILLANDVADNASFTFATGGMLDGAGEMVLHHGSRTGPTATLHSLGDPVVHTPSHTIRGEGTISARLVNEGIIEATDADGDGSAILRITPALGGPITNNHILRATPTSELDIATNMVQGPNGRIIADGGIITASTGPPAEIRGGTLETVNGGVIQHGIGFLELADVTNQGMLNLLGVQFGSTTTVTDGSLTNNGTITVNSTNLQEPTSLAFADGTTLSGEGTVVLGKALTGAIDGARIVSNLNSSFTQLDGHTIRGEGEISASMANFGVIEAVDGNGEGGGLLTLSHNCCVEAAIVNHNVLRAANGGTLQFGTGGGVNVVQEGNGRIEIQNGGLVVLGDHSTRITGGVIEAQGSGMVRAVNKASTVLTDLTLNTDVVHDQVTASAPTVLGGTVVNNGTYTVDHGVIRANSDVLLTGSGTIELNEAGLGTRVETFSASGTTVLTNDVEHTIRGIGTISANMVNNGRLEGRSGSELLTINNFSRISGTGVLKDVLINGTHAPGESTAIVDVEGVYQFGGCCFSTLEVDIQGSDPGSGHDQVNATGDVNLGAARVQVNFTDGGNGLYMPENGMQFEILSSANPIEGSFRTIQGSNMGIGGDLLLVHEENRVLVQIDDPYLIADFDGDEQIGQGDLDLILLNWGQPAGSVPNTWLTDLPSGNVDQGELDKLLLNWGNFVAPANAALNTNPVPEPASWMIAMLTVCLAVMAGTRCRHSTTWRKCPC